MIGSQRFLGRVEANERLHLVVFAGRRVLLVEHEDLWCRRIWTDEGVDLVAVGSSRAFEVAVGHRHGDFPRLAIRACPTPHAARRGLDRQRKPVPADMPLLVVPGLHLRRRGLGRHLLLGARNIALSSSVSGRGFDPRAFNRTGNIGKIGKSNNR